jgi:hypothetical protein
VSRDNGWEFSGREDQHPYELMLAMRAATSGIPPARSTPAQAIREAFGITELPPLTPSADEEEPEGVDPIAA